ncbi:RES domain-containing protein [Rhodococcus ruber]|uniref:RES domain-containing protein n=1 Tax=Rhodococcus ruber TaxID=1830 RepID=A0ABT4M7I5_9NOCA|nr:RES domain-containing protein [Rhodococcus ruber]MCZ4516915.1 RES domain-containing protein [Rhodococcus ruber]
MDSLPARLAEAPLVSVEGQWQRHVPARFAREAVDGRSARGRWGTADAFPVLYLGRPKDSVVVEAYRHLVDPVDDPAMAASIRPRVLVTVEVDVTEILDLRSARGRASAQVTMGQLQSDTNDRSAYEVCQNIAAAAHQLGHHGVITPAATKRGDTLVLFTDILPASQRPSVVGVEPWMQLPSDPRVESSPSLRIVRGTD